ncbi:MAG TPA: hypothetical protein VGG02_03005 [Chthoniobacterales bacterium]|jgi:hypothetical protein
MQPYLGEKAKPFLVGTIGLALAIALGTIIGTSDYEHLTFVALFFVGTIVWFGVGQWFWPIVICSSYLGGTFPILGGSFTTFQILMAIGVAKFIVEEIVLRRKALARVDRSLLIALSGFMLIMTWHGIHDRFGMRFLGSQVWGGRNYVNVYVGLIAFFVTQSISMKPSVWNKLPYFVLAVTSFDLAIGIITTIFPSLILKIYPFYSAVGAGGVTELTTGQIDITGRIGPFGNFGCVLVAIVLAAAPIWRLLTLGNFLRLGSFFLGSVAVLYSGFRSALVNYLFTVMVAGYRDLRGRLFLLVPLILVVLFGLSAFNSSILRLPKQMQRSLVFLPGDWDADMVRDATASNDFRFQVWTLWEREYFPQQPLFGRGFGFRSEWAETSVYDPRATDLDQMVEVGNVHNGLFACVDAVGLVGTVFFVVWTAMLLWRTLHVSFDKANPAGFALRFLGLQLAVSILSYWFGAVTLGTFLPQQFALAGVFLRLSRGTSAKPDLLPGNTIRGEPRPQLVRI